jgi:autotransporter-associated beta strand protein
MGGLRTLTLSGANTYSGSTLVNSGVLALVNSATISTSTNIVIASGATLDASGRTDGALTLVGGQVLQGNGTLTGTLTNGVGAILSPGTNGIGLFTVTGSAALRGTTRMELNRNSLTNDVLQVGSVLSYGGTLSLVNLGGTLAAGDTFKLFNATSCTGAFTSIVPATPAPGLMWDTTALNSNGTLKVAVAPAPLFTSIALAGTNLVFNGTNGQPNEPYSLRAATNLLIPASNWPVMGTGTFDSTGNFSITNSLDATVPKLFYLIQLQ